MLQATKLDEFQVQRREQLKAAVCVDRLKEGLQ
jgi:hypothetical protein